MSFVHEKIGRLAVPSPASLLRRRSPLATFLDARKTNRGTTGQNARHFFGPPVTLASVVFPVPGRTPREIREGNFPPMFQYPGEFCLRQPGGPARTNSSAWPGASFSARGQPVLNSKTPSPPANCQTNFEIWALPINVQLPVKFNIAKAFGQLRKRDRCNDRWTRSCMLTATCCYSAYLCKRTNLKRHHHRSLRFFLSYLPCPFVVYLKNALCNGKWHKFRVIQHNTHRLMRCLRLFLADFVTNFSF